VSDAESILVGRRLVMKIIEERQISDILKQGTVLEQFPYSGENYISGDTVSVVTGAIGGAGWGEW